MTRPVPWPNPRPTATFPHLQTSVGMVTAAFTDESGELLRAIQSGQGTTTLPANVPSAAALTLLARRASDDLELTWTVEPKRAQGRIGAQVLVTVLAMPNTKKQPYRMTIHRQAATPLLVLASLHGVTLLAEQGAK